MQQYFMRQQNRNKPKRFTNLIECIQRCARGENSHILPVSDETRPLERRNRQMTGVRRWTDGENDWLAITSIIDFLSTNFKTWIIWKFSMEIYQKKIWYFWPVYYLHKYFFLASIQCHLFQLYCTILTVFHLFIFRKYYPTMQLIIVQVEIN